MRIKVFTVLAMLPWMASAQTQSQTDVLEAMKQADMLPKIHGTFRGKYEYQPEMEAGRFETRNARVGIEGKLPLHLSYKLQADLSDEGKMKMLDAYASLNPWKTLNITVGQMRVPFTIDAHRGPGKQFFANRSFIAKLVGNVRDVGAKVGYEWEAPFKIIADAGVFGSSGIDEAQKDAWRSDLNYSARIQTFPLKNVNFTASVQRFRCNKIEWAHYTSVDFGAYYSNKHVHVEGEYLRKHYENGICDDVNSFNFMSIYRHKLNKCFFNSMSYLLRWDYMDNHADGKSLYLDSDGEWDGTYRLKPNQAKRHRLTAGLTFHLKASPFNAELRLNYENYFYDSDIAPKTAEQDKVVAELVVNF